MKAREHPFEQAALTRRAVQPGVDYGVLNGLGWLDETAWKTLPAVHIGSLQTEHRVRVMGDTLRHARGAYMSKCDAHTNATLFNATAAAMALLEG